MNPLESGLPPKLDDLHEFAFNYRNAQLQREAQDTWTALNEFVTNLVQAERAATIERCAALCDDLQGEETDGWASAGSYLAAAIRNQP